MSVLPGDLKEREFVINRAMDVRSASMKYLAVSIRHDATRFGTPGTGLSYKRLTEIGRLAKTFFVGDTDIVASKAFLDECIENYSRALRDMAGIPMIIEVREMVKGTYSVLKIRLITIRVGGIKSPKSKRWTN